MLAPIFIKIVNELLPYSGGLTRNIVQCLYDFDIPLYLSHTITEIKGERRVSGAVVMKLDEHRKPIPGTEIDFDCDTILLSVGLIPENELTKKAAITMDPRTKGAVVYENRETSVPGIFACGNAVHVHDLVDFVTEEGQLAGAGAANYVTYTWTVGGSQVSTAATFTPTAAQAESGITCTIAAKAGSPYSFDNLTYTWAAGDFQ